MEAVHLLYISTAAIVLVACLPLVKFTTSFFSLFRAYMYTENCLVLTDTTMQPHHSHTSSSSRTCTLRIRSYNKEIWYSLGTRDAGSSGSHRFLYILRPPAGNRMSRNLN